MVWGEGKTGTRNKLKVHREYQARRAKMSTITFLCNFPARRSLFVPRSTSGVISFAVAKFRRVHSANDRCIRGSKNIAFKYFPSIFGIFIRFLQFVERFVEFLPDIFPSTNYRNSFISIVVENDRDRFVLQPTTAYIRETTFFQVLLCAAAILKNEEGK